MAYLDDILSHAMATRASDVHFSAGEPIRMRIDGDLLPVEGGPLATEQLEAIFAEILTPEETEKLVKNKNLDKSHAIEGVGNFRVNIFYTKRGFASVIRSIPSKIPSMKDLGLPEVIQALCDLPKGLVLVTGPTGSGKSTTLAAMINHINTNAPLHILTAEDPVEFVHQSKMSLVNQREIGQTCHSFADALKYALREDPDVILVGEMRDLETIGLAMTAAETGHLVFGTLHTRGAGASVDRIIDSFPANQQSMVRAMLAESLQAVISQALLKKKDGKGRVAVYEIMVVTPAISNLIREGKAFQIPSVIQTSRKDGMQLMAQHVKELIAAGTITEAEGAPYLEEAGGAKSKSHGGGGLKAAPTAPTPKVMQGPPPGAVAPKPFAPKELTNHGVDVEPAKPAPAPAAKAPVAKAAVPAARPAPAAAPVAAPKPAAPAARPAAPAVPAAAPKAPPAPAAAKPPGPPPAGGPPKPPPMKAPAPPGAPKAAAPPGFAPLKQDEPGGGGRSRPQPPPPPAAPRAPEPAPMEAAAEDDLSIDLNLEGSVSDGPTEMGDDVGEISLEISLDESMGGALDEVSEGSGFVDIGDIPLKKTG